MCLYSKINKAKRAKEDIICYKILIHKKDEKLITPIMGIPVTKNTFYAKFKSLKMHIKFLFTHKIITKYIMPVGFEINEGFIHSYRFYFSALDDSDNNNIFFKLFSSDSKSEVFKCIIPKGTLYYIGENYDYASRKIKFMERII